MTASSEMAPSRLRRFRPDIEGLRAVAVLLVVIGHSGFALPGGFIGVDVFFVISGFLITRQLYDELCARGRVSFSAFYARRARRILPAAGVVILATLCASWVWLSPLRIPPLARESVYAAISGLNWHLAAEGVDYFQAATPPSPLQHYWSLGVEEQFYAIWPLILVAGSLMIWRRVGRRLATVCVLTIIVAGSGLCSVLVTHASISLAYFGLHTRAWELSLGAMIAVSAALLARMSSVLSATMSWVGLGMIMTAAVRFDSTTAYPGIAASLPVLGAACVIAAGCSHPRWGSERILEVRPMQAVGRVSYSWYLWHWPALMLAPEALGRPLASTDTAGVIAGSLVMAALTYQVVERPIRARRGLIEFPQRGIGFGALIVATSVVVAMVVGSAATGAIPVQGSGTQRVAAATAPAGLTVSGVSSLVVDAAGLRTLPQVVPQLAKAKDDGDPSQLCFQSFADTVPKTGGNCVLGHPKASRSIILFGDSHAAQWLGPIRTWATRESWKLLMFAKAACSPGSYPAVLNARLHRDYTECTEWRSHVMAYIESTRPAIVVMTGSWVPEAVSNPGMERTVQGILAAGSKVLFIADTPRMESMVPDCLAKNPTDIQRCAVTPIRAKLTAPGRMAEIQGARRGGAVVFDPLPNLCTSTICPAVINGIVVYRDDNHLTNTYALTMTGQLGAALAPLVS